MTYVWICEIFKVIYSPHLWNWRQHSKVHVQLLTQLLLVSSFLSRKTCVSSGTSATLSFYRTHIYAWLPATVKALKNTPLFIPAGSHILHPIAAISCCPPLLSSASIFIRSKKDSNSSSWIQFNPLGQRGRYIALKLLLSLDCCRCFNVITCRWGKDGGQYESLQCQTSQISI